MGLEMVEVDGVGVEAPASGEEWEFVDVQGGEIRLVKGRLG